MMGSSSIEDQNLRVSLRTFPTYFVCAVTQHAVYMCAANLEKTHGEMLLKSRVSHMRCY